MIKRINELLKRRDELEREIKSIEKEIDLIRMNCIHTDVDYKPFNEYHLEKTCRDCGLIWFEYIGSKLYQESKPVRIKAKIRSKGYEKHVIDDDVFEDIDPIDEMCFDKAKSVDLRLFEIDATREED